MIYVVSAVILGIALPSHPATAPLPCQLAVTKGGAAAAVQPRMAVDTIRLRRFLAAHGYTLERVIASSGLRHAVIGTARGRKRSLLLVQVDENAGLLLHEPIAIGPFTPSFARWFEIVGSSRPAFIYTVDYPSEGVVRSEILASPDTLYRVVYSDVETCKAAEIRDVDGDGEVELLAYSDQPPNAMCISECHIDLEERFGLPMAWVEVRRWNGQAWEPVTDGVAAYYSKLAELYERAAQWAEESPAWTCGPKGAEFLRRWASRAKSLAVKK